MPACFGSDNMEGLSPELLEALVQVNEKPFAIPYGGCPDTSEALAAIAVEVLGATPSSADEHLFSVKGPTDAPANAEDYVIPFAPKDCVFLCFSGTAANCLALGTLCEEGSRHYVVCADDAHIANDETGAPEHLAGAKLETVPTENGKLTTVAADGRISILPVVETIIQKGSCGGAFPHRPQPRCISITQPTERGFVYSNEEIRFLASFAHDHGLYLHVDGARIAQGAMAVYEGGRHEHDEDLLDHSSKRRLLVDHSLYDYTFALGIDCLSLGLTKNGGVMLDCVVFRPGLFSPAFSPVFRAQPGGTKTKAGREGAEFYAKKQRELRIELRKEHLPRLSEEDGGKTLEVGRMVAAGGSPGPDKGEDDLHRCRALLAFLADAETKRHTDRIHAMRKQYGQLNSKMRFQSVQYTAMLRKEVNLLLLDEEVEDTSQGGGPIRCKLWQANAYRANRRARQLALGFLALNEVIAAEVTPMPMGTDIKFEIDFELGTDRASTDGVSTTEGSTPRGTGTLDSAVLPDAMEDFVRASGRTADTMRTRRADATANVIFARFPDTAIVSEMKKRGHIFGAWEGLLMRFICHSGTTEAEVAEFLTDLEEVTKAFLKN